MKIPRISPWIKYPLLWLIIFAGTLAALRHPFINLGDNHHLGQMTNLATFAVLLLPVRLNKYVRLALFIPLSLVMPLILGLWAPTFEVFAATITTIAVLIFMDNDAISARKEPSITSAE